MTKNLSPKIAHILHLSQLEARRCKLSGVGSIALLLGILRDEECAAHKMIERFGIPTETLRAALQESLPPHTNETTSETDAPFDPEVERILRLSQLEARLQKAEEATDVHVLLALLRDHVNEGCKAMSKFNIDYKKAIHLLNLKSGVQPAHGSLGLADDDSNENTTGKGSGSGDKRVTTTTAPAGSQDTPIIDNYGTDLTRAAAEGVLDPIVGRHDEIERMAQILSRRKKNNPILIGAPGVGKSALVEGLAQLIVQNKVPHLLANKRIVSLDMATIVAGTQYRGQFEERLRRLIDELKKHREIILFIDEIHTIIGAGSAPGSLDAANILKPALARGEVQCIGATTICEFKKTIEKDGALDRRFQKIQLEATSPEDTLQILRNIKDRYEDHHNVIYTDEALEACVRLTERYIADRSLPDKAIDALDEAGSRVHLLNVRVPKEIEEKEVETTNLRTLKEAAASRQEYELAANLRDQLSQAEAELKGLKENWQQDLKNHRVTVDLDDIAGVVSMISGVPAERMKESENIRLKGMKTALSEKVIAQNRAIERLTRAITRNRLGLKDPNRPIGTFMFVGPTGVGKTHLVKTLAEFMFGRKDALIRIDMSEYGEKFSTSRLVGAPPGYVGYEEGGQLTEQVRRHPYSIILLDEIEKAHPDVFNTLLQVMDEGRMTDGNGTTVDFRNTIIIMTSNSGSRQIKEFGAGIGFSASKEGLSADAAESIVRKALQRQFAPEFLNRIDDVIMFEPLNRNSITLIADLEIKALADRLASTGHTLHITPEATAFVAQKGYEPQYGARSLKRTIQELIEDPVCDLFLDGQQGTHLHVELAPSGDKLHLSFSDHS
ncbi:ATP-dependent Clp protease ATP-binding subunit [Alloprevotella sp. OH1205_COT-284]|uniref:ATP-dependent Clp protease ATP-binding subunit n=1 Tax=Alloprevotella sp. OH1205_COT-284 TaxID=2491043 RepID=UPI000F600D83|nr:ATP-dependent Clp protease ATP-binding subunit [Alloprevotella sp. OH1205_COT-284]RRD80465.1 ATP-dependent Clp protease ATP-binding subunit [Alloprevotella sp. OH1205_COT-284]